MHQPTVLIVDDEASIRAVAQAYLQHAGFLVLSAETGPEALRLVAERQPDLMILDLNLPGRDGMQITADLRAAGSEIFILMLTARSEEADRVAGLRVGADDYLTKPFSPSELVARVEAILRRRRALPNTSRALQFGPLTIDPEARLASVGTEALDLTPTEFDLLLALAHNTGRALSRERLIDIVWGNDFFGTDRVVDVYVGQVRRKIEALGGHGLINTVRGVGYRLDQSPR